MPAWAREAGFGGDVHYRERRWQSSPTDELRAIALRSWPAMRELDEATIDEVTRPTIEALRALPPDADVRRATAEILVLHRN